MSTPVQPPQLIQDARGLDELLRDLEGQTEIGFDTEADSFFCYREKVCLIQISADGRDYVVDPLAGFDLSGLGEVLADPERTKIFHDGEYDILILKRDLDFEFANIFDTRVAAAALGYANTGLAAVIDQHFGHQLDKSLQRSNWSMRPLTREQIDYARYDTHFLVRLMHILSDELVSRDRRMILEGECRRLEQLQAVEPSFNPDEFIRIKRARTLSPTVQQNLRELFTMREELARESNLPPFKVIANPALMILAEAAPRTMEQLAASNGVSVRQARRYGRHVLEALARARRLGPLKRPPVLPRKDGTGGLSEEQMDLHEALKRWRKHQADLVGIDASLVLNRHVLVRLACSPCETLENLASVEGLLTWQVELLGAGILEAVRTWREGYKPSASRREPWRRH